MIGIFLDSEENGLNPFVHEMIDIAFKLVNLSNGKEIDSYESIIFQTKATWAKSNLKSLEVNGFTYDMLLEGKKENEVKKDIIDLFSKHRLHRKNSVFICHNPSADRIFFSKLIDPDLQDKLFWPYHWLDLASMYWAIQLKKTNSLKSFVGFSKDKIAKSLNLPSEETPHRAIRGVNHLLLCYEKLVGFPKKKI
jgi:oligoribonuclease